MDTILVTCGVVAESCHIPFCQSLQPCIDFSFGSFESQPSARILVGWVVSLLEPGFLRVVIDIFDVVLSQKVRLVASPGFAETGFIVEHLIEGFVSGTVEHRQGD